MHVESKKSFLKCCRFYKKAKTLLLWHLAESQPFIFYHSVLTIYKEIICYFCAYKTLSYLQLSLAWYYSKTSFKYDNKNYGRNNDPSRKPFTISCLGILMSSLSLKFVWWIAGKLEIVFKFPQYFFITMFYPLPQTLDRFMKFPM